MSDFKVRLSSNLDEIFYDPDVMVACGREGLEEYYARNPELIVEVLSPSTEATDRREKFVNYRRIPTLEEYALIAQDARKVTIYRRGEGWSPQPFIAARANAEFRSIDLPLSLAEIYADAL